MAKHLAKSTGAGDGVDVAPYWTQAGLAGHAGLTRHAVAKAILRGHLATVPSLDGVPLIARDEADRWLAERRQGPGRPRKPE